MSTASVSPAGDSGGDIVSNQLHNMHRVVIFQCCNIVLKSVIDT